MIDSLTATVRKYLKAFGIQRLDVLPSAFLPTVAPQWDVFTKQFRVHSKDDLRTAAYLCIEFARYMRAIQIPPFRTAFRDPITHLQFRPDKAYEQLFTSILADFQNSISSEVRKLRLHDLELTQVRFHVDVPVRRSCDLEMRFTLLVKPAKHQQLTSNLLVNPTFSSGTNPEDLAPQLRNSKKLVRGDDLLTTGSDLGWLKLKSSPIKILAQRGREEHLAVRFVWSFPNEMTFGTPVQTKAKIANLWRTLVRTTRFGPKL